MKTFTFEVKGTYNVDAIDQEQAFDYLMRDLNRMIVTNTEIIEESDDW